MGIEGRSPCAIAEITYIFLAGSPAVSSSETIRVVRNVLIMSKSNQD